ncbi:MAG: type II 3-dehydroquinate dehydratase [Cryomorphaceae bacterium]|nr:MAG: type II 3-dehydroquinate dehydratase [Cryomorphaceae bacterium]
MRIAIINGPNLNMLGKREPEIYGNRSFEDYLNELKTFFPDVEFAFYQSNVEGELVNAIQQCGSDCDGLVLNAAAYSHTSLALADAVKTVPIPVIEVHISNVYAREPERHRSLLSAYCTGLIVGLGLDGYRLAISHFLFRK